MKLDTCLNILERNIKLVMMFVEDRRINPANDSRNFMEQVNLAPAISEISQMELGIMSYGGTLYRELADRLDEKIGVKIDREVISILNKFKEYSFSMFPDTRYDKYVCDGLTNEDCAKYLVDGASDEDIANAKAMMLQQWREDCNSRYFNFKKHIGSILDEDIVTRAVSILHNRIMEFAVMLDCILLENHNDLIKMQAQYGIKIINDHDKIVLAEYTGMKGYSEKLLREIGSVDGDSLFSILKLMPEIDGERPRFYFRKAIEVGYMNYNTNGYCWLFGGKRGGKARLGYFLEKIYCLKVTDRLSSNQFRQLESLFNTIRLDSAFYQNAGTGKTQSVRQWRNEIDNLFLD